MHEADSSFPIRSLLGGPFPTILVMMAIVRTVAGVLLLAHGLVHLLYLASDVQEFSFDRSWVVPESLRRQVGLGLMVATVVAFALVALAVCGVPRMSAD